MVSDEEAVQIGRLRYSLENGCKEGLVMSPLDWPGLSTAAALYNGESSLEGEWIDRTGLYYARRRGEEVTERDFLERVPVHLTPLPCWSTLSWSERRDEARGLIVDIERATRARHRDEGTRPLGAKQVLAANPLARPAAPKKSPAPMFHATGETRKRLVAAYRLFVDAYTAASRAFRGGLFDVEFPDGSFRPPGGFVVLPANARAPD